MNIPLSGPDIDSQDIEAVVSVLETSHLSLGPKLIEFEQKMAEYTGVKHAVAVNSGTSALHLMIRALGLQPGDEVITTPFSFVASSNCILFEGGKPVFVDIDPHTYNLDIDLIEQAITPKTKGILAVDVFGQPPDWDRLDALVKKHDLFLIEDSAEAIGATYKGRKAGSLGDVGLFAFYPNKQMTTGEGGIIVTDDDKIATLCKSMRNQGRDEGAGWLQHARLGFNFRLSDINCALGITQLARLDEMLAKRAQVAAWYNDRFEDVADIKTICVSPDVKMSWFVYVARLADHYFREDRDEILGQLRAKGIQCSNYFTPIHLQPFYQTFGYAAGDFPVTEQVSERTVALPFFNHLEEAQVDIVVNQLKQLLK